MQNGKGDTPRTRKLKKYQDNYSEINWGKKIDKKINLNKENNGIQSK